MGNAKSLIYRKLNQEVMAELLNNEDVDFTRAEIEEWYHEFQLYVDKEKAKLTPDVFKKIYNRVYMGDATPFAYHIFRTFDMSGDGYVDFREFIMGLSVSGSKNPNKKLRWAFKMYDINGDGRITRDEMTCILTDIYKMTNARTNDDLGSPEHITDMFFTHFDLNHDGELSFHEFKNGANTDPLIIHLLECDPDP